jgi:D-glycero-alpha-D-manno-heptose-7-phosphate kinase
MANTVIKARAPLRLGLAGGGTDVSPYCDNYTGYILNITIDRYAYAVIKKIKGKIKFIAADINKSEVLAPQYPLLLDCDLKLHRAVYNYFVGNYNNGKPLEIELSTFCDAPAGSGLGSSSTLVVAMVKAFMELFNLSLDDYQVALIAYKIERNDCGLAGGRQDQYAATFGGVNFMEFYAENRTIVNPLRIKPWIINELEASLILFYTGVSRESANIIDEQAKGVSAGSIATVEALHGVKAEASEMKEALLKGDFRAITTSMIRGWENKKRSAKTISNPLIEEIFEAAMRAGAVAGKVSGAGGGGFIMFMVPTERRMDVIRKLSEFKGQVSNCHFTPDGCESWRVQ